LQHLFKEKKGAPDLRPLNPDKPEPNIFYVWPQKTPLGREQLGLEPFGTELTAEVLVAEKLGAERQNTTEVKNLFL
jgi:hypothetical protein